MPRKPRASKQPNTPSTQPAADTSTSTSERKGRFMKLRRKETERERESESIDGIDVMEVSDEDEFVLPKTKEEIDVGYIEHVYGLDQEICSNHAYRNCRDNPFCFLRIGMKTSDDGFNKYAAARLRNALNQLDGDPALLMKEKGAKVGLDNLGNTCWLGSLLQCLVMIPDFRDAIFNCDLGINESALIPSPSPSSSSSQRQMLTAIIELFGKLYFGNRKSISPHDFVNVFKIPTGTQQDVSEFLNLFLHFLGSVDLGGERGGGVRGSEGQSVLQSAANRFMGLQKNVIVCSKCGRSSETPAEYQNVQLSIHKMKTLHECLLAYFGDETMDGSSKYRCSVCDSLQDAKRHTRLESVPDILTIQLLRFAFDMKTGTKKKVTDRIVYPASIDMNEYLFIDEDKEARKKRGQDLFDLHAVISHIGQSAMGGHYIARVKDSEGESEGEGEGGGKWWLFDDSNVSADQPPWTQVKKSVESGECVESNFEKEKEERKKMKMMKETTSNIVVMVDNDDEKKEEKEEKEKVGNAYSSVANTYILMYIRRKKEKKMKSKLVGKNRKRKLPQTSTPTATHTRTSLPCDDESTLHHNHNYPLSTQRLFQSITEENENLHGQIEEYMQKTEQVRIKCTVDDELKYRLTQQLLSSSLSRDHDEERDKGKIGASHPGCYIPTTWLIDYFKNDGSSETPPVDLGECMCSHGHLLPARMEGVSAGDGVSDTSGNGNTSEKSVSVECSMKRIDCDMYASLINRYGLQCTSRTATGDGKEVRRVRSDLLFRSSRELLRQLVADSHSRSSSSALKKGKETVKVAECMECVWSVWSEECAAQNAEGIRERIVQLLNKKETDTHTIDVEGEGEGNEFVLVSRKLIQAFRSEKLTDDPQGDCIVCEHGCSKPSQARSLTAVSSLILPLLAEYNSVEHISHFSEDTEPCVECVAVQKNRKNVRRKTNKEIFEQHMKLQAVLCGERGSPWKVECAVTGTAYHIVSKEWINSLRTFYEESQARVGVDQTQTPFPSVSTTHSILCPHSGLMVDVMKHTPPITLSRPVQEHSVVSALYNDFSNDAYEIISEEQWRVLSSECRSRKHSGSVFDESVKLSVEYRRGSAVPMIRTDPEMCAECTAACEREVQNECPEYDNSELFVLMVSEKDREEYETMKKPKKEEGEKEEKGKEEGEERGESGFGIVQYLLNDSKAQSAHSHSRSPSKPKKGKGKGQSSTPHRLPSTRISAKGGRGKGKDSTKHLVIHCSSSNTLEEIKLHINQQTDILPIFMAIYRADTLSEESALCEDSLTLAAMKIPKRSTLYLLSIPESEFTESQESALLDIECGIANGTALLPGVDKKEEEVVVSNVNVSVKSKSVSDVVMSVGEGEGEGESVSEGNACLMIIDETQTDDDEEKEVKEEKVSVKGKGKGKGKLTSGSANTKTKRGRGRGKSRVSNDEDDDADPDYYGVGVNVESSSFCVDTRSPCSGNGKGSTQAKKRRIALAVDHPVDHAHDEKVKVKFRKRKKEEEVDEDEEEKEERGEGEENVLSVLIDARNRISNLEGRYSDSDDLMCVTEVLGGLIRCEERKRKRGEK